MKLGTFIDPVKLPKGCGEELQNPVAAIIAGNGRIAFANELTDGILRYAYLATVHPDDCRAFANNPADPKSLICAYSLKGNSICLGDSGTTKLQHIPKKTCHLKNINFAMFWLVLGGPLLREYDEALLGITSYVKELVHQTTKEISYFQVFSNIYYHYEWISNVTGLQLPTCWNSY